MSKRLPPCSSCGCDVVTCYGCGQRRADVEMLWEQAEAMSRADAEFIVRACNAHEELLAALKRSLDWLASYQGNAANGAYGQARAAIAKAEATHG